MKLGSKILLLVAGLLVACGRAPVSVDATAGAPPYSINLESQQGSQLKLDWYGEGRELASGQVVEVSPKNGRRMVFVNINLLASQESLPWRSTLDRLLKLGEVQPSWVRTEPLERAKLVRAYLPNDTDAGDFFFRRDVGPDLNGDMYVARCSKPLSWEKGAIHCNTALQVDLFAVEISFDKAFLWDFDHLQSSVVGAVKNYVARSSTQQLIKSIPRLGLR